MLLDIMAERVRFYRTHIGFYQGEYMLFHYYTAYYFL